MFTVFRGSIYMSSVFLGSMRGDENCVISFCCGEGQVRTPRLENEEARRGASNSQ